MSCMCGATDCPSCGRDQGYEVIYIPGVGWRNPEDDEDRCPECGSWDTHTVRHHADALAPECLYYVCETCEHQWGHS